ncbi:transposase [Achromatium sp. WMS3]|nr:transposase [Achromatium sp. WMS3]
MSARKPTGKINYANNGTPNLTKQGGVVPVIKFLDKIKFHNIFNSIVHHERPPKSEYQLSDVVFLVLIGQIVGGTNMAQCLVTWTDVVLRRTAGWIRIPDPTTVGRIFKELKERHINEMESLVHKMRQQIWEYAFNTGVSHVARLCVQWIDVDSTVKTVYGHQEGAAKGYNPHKKGALSYHPLLAFLPQTKEILQGWFRAGDAYTSNGIVEFMKQLLANMPQDNRFIIRGDSGFFVGALLDFLDANGHGYLIKVKLKGLKELLLKQEWQPIPGRPGWEQCSFQYKLLSWIVSRSFVAVRKLIKEKPNTSQQTQLFDPEPELEYEYFCYVTTEIMGPWLTHKTYGKRATSETWIEEAKGQIGLSHILTSEFLANAALFQTAILAYNMLCWMSMLSGNDQLRRWEPKTIRIFLIQVAGKLLTSGRQLRLLFSPNHLYPKVWNVWLALGS